MRPTRDQHQDHLLQDQARPIARRHIASRHGLATLISGLLAAGIALVWTTLLTGCGEDSGPRSVSTLMPTTLAQNSTELGSPPSSTPPAQGQPATGNHPAVQNPTNHNTAIQNTAAPGTLAQNTAAPNTAPAQPVADQPPLPADPLAEQLRQAIETALARLDKMPGYTYTLRKQELVGDDLLDPQTLDCKLRHDPFSVYLRFTSPDNVKGKEAIYVEGKNNGKLIGHGVGFQALLGTQQLDPQGTLAMMGNRHPITNSGMRNLMNRLKKAYEGDQFRRYCRVQLLEGEKVDDRPTVCFEAHNPQPNNGYPLARAKIWFDQQWQLPVRYQSHYWNAQGKEQLTEDYTYLKVKLDVELTDEDFNPKNPDYQFP